MDLLPRPWTWLVAVPALLPVVLLLAWGRGWRRASERLPRDWVVFALLIASAVMLLRGTQVSQRPFDADAERDWAAALLLSRGIEFPFRGPAIAGLRLHMGPTYAMITAGLTAVTENPRRFVVLPLLAQIAALWISAGFLRRAFGGGAACAFALLWVGCTFLADNLRPLTHDYLAYPLVALLIWVCWDVARTRDGRFVPLACLLAGLAIQLYAVHAVLLVLVLGVVAVRRVKVGLRTSALALGVLLLTQGVTLALFLGDLRLDDLRALAGGGMAPGDRALRELGAGFWNLLAPAHKGDVWAYLFPLSLVAFFPLSLTRRGRAASGPARTVIALAFAAAAVPMVAYHERFADRFLVIFLPATLMASAVGFADALRALPWRATRGAVLALLGASVIVKAVLAMPPRWTTASVHGRASGDWYRAGRLGPRAIALLPRTHALELESPFLELVAMTSGDALPFDATATDIYLSTDPREQPEPGTRVADLPGRPVPMRAIAYRTSLDRGAMRVSAARLSGIPRPFPLPYRPDSMHRWSQVLVRSVTGRASGLPLVLDPAREGNTRIRVGVPGGAAISRRIAVVTAGGCAVTVVDGPTSRVLSCHGSSAERSRQWCIIPPAGTTGVGAPREVEVDLRSCPMHVLDIFDLPLR